jgi:hypothetical protein
MAFRLRNPELALASGGFVVAFCVTLTAIVVVRYRAPDHAAANPPSPVHVQAGENGPLTPAVLDRQWITYSNRSTCADRSGGDGASAVRLSSSQIAWFFSDSSLGPAGPRIGFSQQSGFVHNLVVMQTTRGMHSRLVTVTGGHACADPGGPSHPVSVVSAANAGGGASQRYWADDGLRIGPRVLRFYTRFEPGRVPFVPVATVIAEFPVGQLARDGRGPAFDAVIRPRITKVPTYRPSGIGTPIVWGASLLRHNRMVYIYGWQNSSPTTLARHCYLARVAASRLTDITAWRFYDGGGGWVASEAGARPIAADTNLSVDTGFSVVTAAGRYWLIEHAGGLGSPRIEAYPGPRPWGPFDTAAALMLYRAPGIGLTQADRYQIMYEARAEPALSSHHTLVISYNVNSLAVTAGCIPLTAFTNEVPQPRFIAVPRAVFGAATSGTTRLVNAAAGPNHTPPIAGKHDPRWFDSWKYSGGCPPLQAVRNVAVTRTKHSVIVRWQAAGPGVRYRVYLRSHDGRYVLLRIARTSSVTFRQLTRGSRYEVLIVPQTNHRKGPGTSIIIRGM